MRKEYLVKPKTVVVTTSHLGPLSCHWQSHRLMSWNNQQRSFKVWLKECWVCELFYWISSSEERQDRARNKKGDWFSLKRGGGQEGGSESPRDPLNSLWHADSVHSFRALSKTSWAVPG